MPTVEKWSFLATADVYVGGRLVGNTLAAQLNGSEQVINQRDYRNGQSGNYASVRRLEGLELVLSLADYSPENLTALQRGTSTTIAAGAITDESISARSSLNTLIRTAYMIDTGEAVVVTTDPAGTTYDDDVADPVDPDYQVTPSGIYVLSTGDISADDALLIDYTKLASKKNEAYTAASAQSQIIIEAKNEVTGYYHRLTFHSGELGIATQRMLMSGDAMSELPATFSIEADTTITTSGLSQYFVEELATAAV
jgi:hypothetical protein